MAINLDYGDSFKRTSLVSVMDSLKTELFALCIQNGIDPELLDISNPDSDPKISGANVADHNYHAIGRIKQVCEGYALAKEKLDNLGA
jgi:hypothetical protein